MKKNLFLLLLLISVQRPKAQTFDEWFKQRKTQRKYLVEQIAALRTYLGVIQKGYLVAEKGLSTIETIKNGDFHLHAVFFNSLKEVNPAIKNNSIVADIVAYQAKIIYTYKTTIKIPQISRLFTPGDTEYIQNVFTNLVNESTSNVLQLTYLVTPRELEMKDDERIKRLDAIYMHIQEQYLTTKRFADEIKILALARAKEQNDIDKSRKLFGINN